MRYGIQMYSLRDITETDLYGALKAVAKLGYKDVEYAGFFGHSAETVRAWQDELGLSCPSTHTGADAFLNDFKGTVAYHKTIGCDRLIIPGHNLSTRERLDEFIDICNEYQPKLKAEGITLAYHNHSGEFIPTGYGAIIHEELQKRTRMDFQIDTYWAFNAGVDPVALLEKLSDRVHTIHVKDGVRGGEGKPLGAGEAPVARVVETAKRFGMGLVVESETLQPDGVTEARLCIEYLRSLEK